MLYALEAPTEYPEVGGSNFLEILRSTDALRSRAAWEGRSKLAMGSPGLPESFFAFVFGSLLRPLGGLFGKFEIHFFHDLIFCQTFSCPVACAAVSLAEKAGQMSTWCTAWIVR